MNKAKLMFVVAGAAFALSAQAQLRVEISGVGSNQIPVAIGPCANEASAPAQISEIVKADLTRSGMFKIIDATPTTNLMQTEATSWKARGADALVACSVQTLGNGQFEVQYRLMSTVQGNDLSGFRAPMPNQYGRLAAHKIADDVYEHMVYDLSMHQTVSRHPHLSEPTLINTSSSNTYHDTSSKESYADAPPSRQADIRPEHHFNV